MCVIERTPTRFAHRAPKDGFVVVANDLLMLDGSGSNAPGALAQTSCARFDRATARVSAEGPQDAERALAVLRDPQVQMDITAQHMVFRAKTVLLDVRIPTPKP